MKDKNNLIKVLVSLLCVIIVGVPCFLLYTARQDMLAMQAQFDEYKLASEKELENEKKALIDIKKKISFPELKYEIGDTNYGSLGVASSGTFLELVVDWREDPVYNPQEKTAYLTFDDGPSDRTVEILNILDEYKIKATFFVLGTRNEDNIARYKEIVDRGHTLGIHSQTHKYDQIYASTEAFLADYNEIFSTLKEKTGTTPVLFRFPGGSTNYIMVKNKTFYGIKTEMEDRGFTYYDWNVSGEDSTYKTVDAQIITENVLNGAKDKHKAIILLHDSSGKHSTVEALPAIIKGLQESGFAIDKLTPDLIPLQFK